ncbi:Plasminogen (Fragment) [Seminavis robusta]|uniref:Plasminogen n=1 Tax=Seminavis robusta TaxID=568900 RepID=A0A9N8DKG3_9STRA
MLSLLLVVAGCLLLVVPLSAVDAQLPESEPTERKQNGFHGHHRLRGQRQLDAGPRIVGGVDSGQFERTWIVMLGTSGRRNQCHGTLIHPQIVMTSATCISDSFGGFPFSVVVRPNDNNMRQPVTAIDSRTHPCYDPVNYKFDIALVKLNVAMPASWVVEWAGFNGNRPGLFDGNFLRIVGFGATNETTKSMSSPALQEASLSYVRNCAPRETGNQGEIRGIPGYDRNTHLCAAAANSTEVGPCSGDSGSPIGRLNLDIGAEFLQVGILTGFYPNRATTTCGETSHYYLYTRIYEMSNWIKIELCVLAGAYCNAQLDPEIHNGRTCSTAANPPCAPRQWVQAAANQITNFASGFTQPVSRYFGGDSP